MKSYRGRILNISSFFFVLYTLHSCRFSLYRCKYFLCIF